MWTLCTALTSASSGSPFPLGLLFFYPPLLASNINEMFNLATDSSAGAMTASAKKHCGCWDNQGNGALRGLQGNQANSGEMTGLKPLSHAARMSGRDPEVFSCHPSGDTTLKGTGLTSLAGAWSTFCEPLQEEADKNLVRQWGLGDSSTVKTCSYLSC